jgi:hypothetical protein
MKHFFERHLASTVKAELAVAPRATQVASGQTHEDAGEASVGRLALQRFVDFGYLKH